MSHFTVLVVGNDPEKQLAPFHEFECTGHDDEFVQDVDETEERRSSYEKGKSTQYQDQDGNYHDPYQDKFYREPTEEEKPKVGMGHGTGGGLSWSSKDWGDGKGYRAKIHFIPEGFKEVEVPYTQLMTFTEYALRYEGDKAVEFGKKPNLAKEHKYGYALLNKAGEVEKVIRRTNPNRKWDWYVLGGRWSGFFKLKPGADGELGRPGVFDNVADEGHVDSARIGDIDFKGMMDDAAHAAQLRYEMVERMFGGAVPKLEYRWRDIIDGEQFKDMDIDAKRKFYHDQPAIVRKGELRVELWNGRDSDEKNFAIWGDLEDFQVSKEEYVLRARNSAISTFALLKDGKWYEKGEMGWWGMVANEKDQNKWNEELVSMLTNLPEDTIVSVYDCHI